MPLQALVDRDGQQKSALKIILEEALSTGVESVCLVVSPGDQGGCAAAAGDLASRLAFCRATGAADMGGQLLPRSPTWGRMCSCIWWEISLRQPRIRIRTATGADRGGGVVQRFGRAANARKRVDLLRHRGRPTVRGQNDCTKWKTWWKSPRPPRPSKVADRAGPADGPLPLLFRHARPDADGHGIAGRVRSRVKADGTASNCPPLWRSWLERSDIWRWKCKACGTTSACAMVCSTRSSRWHWMATTAKKS